MLRTPKSRRSLALRAAIPAAALAVAGVGVAVAVARLAPAATDVAPIGAYAAAADPALGIAGGIAAGRTAAGGTAAGRTASGRTAAVRTAADHTAAVRTAARPSEDSAPHEPDQVAPILGAALTIMSDGTAPWEDRPLLVTGLGTLPGSKGFADPGDDIGARDQVVRSADAVIYRASFSVRDGVAEGVVAEVTLSDLAVWDESGLAALRLGGCPGGATVLDGGHRLRCVVGRVETPPAVTVALDIAARVSATALQGDAITASLAVRATVGVPDPDVANCPVPRANGCDAAVAPVTVSAAPAAELVKVLGSVAPAPFGGTEGRRLGWELYVVLGADGDGRGASHPVGAPWVLPDWWQALGPGGRTVSLPVRLLGCTTLGSGATWSCAQPGGPGTPIEVTLASLAPQAWLPGGVSSVLPRRVGGVRMDLWVPETDVRAARGDVTFRNCFATEPGNVGKSLWRPVDARGQSNLGGLAEPPGNNCSYVVLVVPTPTPTPTRTPVPRPPRTPRPGPPRPIPRATPTPRAEAGKFYKPLTEGAAVTDGTEFSADVRVTVADGAPMPGVIACDKWDNSTHALRDGGVGGVRVWWHEPEGERRPATETLRVVVEYATGRWGLAGPKPTNPGRDWYTQGVTGCGDRHPIAGRGWVPASDVDFANLSRRKLNARDVNMVRARILDPVPMRSTVTLEMLFTAGRNRPGTWLMNYGAASWRWPRETWVIGTCYGAMPPASRPVCPVPAAGTKGKPGSMGDMLVHVGVPLWLTKRTDPAVPGGSPVIQAPGKVAFVLEVSTFPRPADPPPPIYPPGAYADGVVLTDTLPSGLIYEVSSARIASEDLNGNGVLDPGEDTNGNGVLDRDVPFPPAISAGPGDGETTLRWYLGNLPYQRRVPAIRYEARASRLVRGGTALGNRAGVWTSVERPPDCRIERADLSAGRCAWAQVIVANIAAAQIEKLAKLPLVLPGEPLIFRLALANLTSFPVEWFDAVDLLPRPGEPRDPVTSLTGGITDVQVNVLPGGAPIQVWASGTDPDFLDALGGAPRDGIVDPVAAWGGPGAGIGGPEWPCRLADVGTSRCAAIAARSRVTAVRLWGPDPQPARSAGPGDSFLPAGGAARWLELTLLAPGTVPGDLANNAWGGRFESLPLPVFAEAVIRVRPPDTPTPTATATTTDTPPPSETPVPSDTPTPAPPTETPTPTSTLTPSRTPTPTDTLTPSSTPTTTLTPTPMPTYVCYLPVGVRTKCRLREVDVVLVVDASTSMLREAGDGGTKQEAVLRAARAFLDRFAPDPAHGRVAVVAFNDRAWLVQPLTGDRSRLDRALDQIVDGVAEGTRLDLGLLVGADALGGVESGRWRAMVFLTDGMPNRIPTPIAGGSQEDVVRAAAAELHRRGIPVFTVGYGRADAPDLADRILPWLLREIAGRDGAYYETDDAGALADRFRLIATTLGCLGTVRWP